MDPQRLGASHKSLSCPTPGGGRSRENVKRLPWGQQAGEGRPGWGGVACPAPVAEPLGRDQCTVGTDSGRCRGASRGPGPVGAAARGGGVAAACWTVGVTGDVAPGQRGARFPRPYVGAVQRDLPGRRGGRGCRGGRRGARSALRPRRREWAPGEVAVWRPRRVWGLSPCGWAVRGRDVPRRSRVLWGLRVPGPVRSSSAGGSSEQRPRATRPPTLCSQRRLLRSRSHFARHFLKIIIEITQPE